MFAKQNGEISAKEGRRKLPYDMGSTGLSTWSRYKKSERRHYEERWNIWAGEELKKKKCGRGR